MLDVFIRIFVRPEKFRFVICRESVYIASII